MTEVDTVYTSFPGKHVQEEEKEERKPNRGWWRAYSSVVYTALGFISGVMAGYALGSQWKGTEKRYIKSDPYQYRQHR